MQCECCGRETDVLVEIGAVSRKVPATGKCCLQCCAFILGSLVGEQAEERERAEFLTADEKQAFADGSGAEIGADEIRFGMRDAGGKIHYFCVRRIEHLPEMTAFEIYPKEEFRRKDSDRTEYVFRTFGLRKSDRELFRELMEKIETALMNPAIEMSIVEIREYSHRHTESRLRERGAVQVERRNGEVWFRVDGKLTSPEEFAGLLSPYEGFFLTYQMRDALEKLPDRDTYYLPVKITDEILLDELNALIVSVGGESDFISYRNMQAFDIGFFGIIDKLELYFRSNPPGVGKIAGLKLIKRLEELGTDDDMIPEYQVGLIRDLIGEY